MKTREIAQFVKKHRKQLGLTQAEFAMNAGVGLRLVRDLEQGKLALQMNKVLQVLALFNAELVPRIKEAKETEAV